MFESLSFRRAEGEFPLRVVFFLFCFLILYDFFVNRLFQRLSFGGVNQL